MFLRLKKGQELTLEVSEFCKKHNLTSAFFYGLGATQEVELAFYHLGEKKYLSKVFSEPLELASLIGNVALKDNQLALHIHGVFTRPDFSSIGGHVNKAIVGGTIELYFQPLVEKLERRFDEETGLNLVIG